MNIFLLVLSYILVINLGFVVGYTVCGIFKKVGDYSGTMKVIRDENKVLYSLELHEDPIMLEHKKEVVFKVDTSDQSQGLNLQSQAKLVV
jgi:hypothetical protein